NLAGGVVRPHRNGLAHGKPPQFAILNHAAIDSGIPRESATQRLGITRHLRRPLRSTPGPACTGAPTSATAGANRKTTVPVALSASASTCRNLNTSTASSAASKPATTISLEHGCSGWKPTSRPPVRKAARTTDHKLQWFGTTRPRLGFLATP